LLLSEQREFLEKSIEMASSRFEIAKNSPLSVTPVNKKQRNNSKESMNVSDNNQYNTYEILNEKF